MTAEPVKVLSLPVPRGMRPERAIAAVRGYDLSKPGDVEKVAKDQEEWQASAWFYADKVGEMKDANRFVSNSIRRVRFYAGFIRQPDQEPVPVLDATAEQRADDAPPNQDPGDVLGQAIAIDADRIVDGFRSESGGQATLTGRFAVNLFVAGEAWIINRSRSRPVRTVAEDGTTVDDVEYTYDWEVRSTSEVRKSRTLNTVLETIDYPGQQEGEPLGESAWVERVWRQHDQWSGWADSNIRAAIGVLEELYLLDMLARVSTRSRVTAGIILMPDELDFGAADQPAGEGSGAPSQGVHFDRDLEEVMSEAVTSESDPATVVPIPLRGKAEWLKEVRVIEMPRRYGQEERSQHAMAIEKFGRTIELPVERLSGMGDVNHWTAWQISEDTYAAYIEPLAGMIAEALTYSLLRPLLRERGYPDTVVDRIVVAADPSMLVQRADHGKVADEGHKNGSLSHESWRRTNRFGDDDAPNDEELLLRAVLERGTLGPELTAAVLEDRGMLPEGFELPDPNAVAPGPSEDVVDRPVPDGPADAERSQQDAAAASGAVSIGERLAAIDRGLFDRLTVAASGALGRAVDRAGARLRTRAQRVPAARDALAAAGNIPNAGVAAALGPDLTGSLVNDLVDEDWADLHLMFDFQVRTAQRTAMALSGMDPDSEVGGQFATMQDNNREDAWAWLAVALAAEAALVLGRAGAPESVPADSEFDVTLLLAPVIIREALAIAGGTRSERTRADGLIRAAASADEPVGAVATGDLVRRMFESQGLAWTGYRWDYGDMSMRSRPFQPHLSLSGRTFARWTEPELSSTSEWPPATSYYPGDHRWCKCSFTPVVGEPGTVPA